MTSKWIPIKRRPLTEEERESILDYYGANYEFTSDDYAFDCRMPEEGQKILISTPWGVSIDVCEYDCTGNGLSLYSLEENGDWDGVTAWLPLPEPYKEEKYRLSEYPLCMARDEALCEALKGDYCTDKEACPNKGRKRRIKEPDNGDTMS